MVVFFQLQKEYNYTVIKCVHVYKHLNNEVLLTNLSVIGTVVTE